ncbi:adult cuticle protein 1-like [Drosophila guanche]|uniref:Blast:Adult cuticle protein 1 n=1 Tax=Drosophila guanche TaxID=7266 RepID=A0A3B0JBC9_DROGU|nr:adult cuticle protein 1-like [Drosophila guanche]SPP79657.1 blast:Adult cuticle protein 1 [Drosophila guanche]
MKFAVAAVFTLALALGVQSSVIPLVSQLAGHGLSYTAVSGPAVLASPWAHAAAPWAAGPWGHPAAAWPAAVSVGSWPPAAVHAPAVVAAAHAPAVVVGPVAHEGVYTAQTRGAVHTAPLAGHIQSVASINAAPAPGTL